MDEAYETILDEIHPPDLLGPLRPPFSGNAWLTLPAEEAEAGEILPQEAFPWMYKFFTQDKGELLAACDIQGNLNFFVCLTEEEILPFFQAEWVVDFSFPQAGSLLIRLSAQPHVTTMEEYTGLICPFYFTLTKASQAHAAIRSAEQEIVTYYVICRDTNTLIFAFAREIAFTKSFTQPLRIALREQLIILEGENRLEWLA